MLLQVTAIGKEHFFMLEVCFVLYDASVLAGDNKASITVANNMSKYYHVSIVSLCGDHLNGLYKLNSGIKINFAKLPVLRLRQQIPYAVKFLKSYFIKKHIDVAILEGYTPAGPSAFVRLFCRTKLVFCDHSSCMGKYNDNSARMIRKIATLLCHRTIALTEVSRNDYMKYFHLSEKKCRCIYNWIDAEEFEKGKNCSYDCDSHTIVSLGRFGPEKGYDLMVKVAEKFFSERNDDWTWEVYGDGETFDEISAEVDHLGLNDKLKLMGRTDDVESVYRKAALLVLPSYREGMPLVLLEGKCYKLPLVSFDINTGPKEIITDEKNGYLVPPYDVDIMAKRIAELADNKDLRTSMSEQAHYDIDRFSQQTILQQWLDLIEELVRK